MLRHPAGATENCLVWGTPHPPHTHIYLVTGSVRSEVSCVSSKGDTPEVYN